MFHASRKSRSRWRAMAPGAIGLSSILLLVTSAADAAPLRSIQPSRHFQVESVWSGAISPWYNRSAVWNGLLFTTNKRSLQIFDLNSDWASIADQPTDGIARGLALDPPLAYVVDGPAGLKVFDVSNPAAPELISRQCHAGGDLRGITLRDSFAYCAAWDGGFDVIDIHNPACPRLAEHLDTDGATRASAFSGDWLYITEFDQGIGIYDASLAPSLVPVGQLPTTGAAWDLEIQGDRLYVADGPAGFEIYDISVPTAPTLVASAGTIGYAYSVVVQDNYAHISDGRGGLVTFDISQESSPEMVNQLNLGAGLARHLILDGDAGYVANSDAGLWSLDFTDPAHPTPDGGAPQDLSHARSLAQTDTNLLVAGMRHAGVFLYDLTNPTQPEQVGSIPAPAGDQSYAVVTLGQNALVASGNSGLLAYDLTDPAHPVLLDAAETIGSERTISTQEDLAFVTAGGGRVAIYDISDLSNMNLLGIWSTAEPVRLGTASPDGNDLWLPASWLGVIRLDISNPSHPTAVDTVGFPGGEADITGVFATADRLYAADDAGPVHLIRKPDLQILDSYPTVGHPENIGIIGRQIGITLHEMGILLVDNTPGLNFIQPLARLETTGAVFDFQLDNGSGVLYVADDWEIGASTIN